MAVEARSPGDACLQETTVAKSVQIPPQELVLLSEISRHTGAISSRMGDLAQGDRLRDHLEALQRHMAGALAAGQRAAKALGMKPVGFREVGVVASACPGCGTVQKRR